MNRLNALKSARSLTDLAHLLGYKPKAVSYILYRTASAQRYTTFQIPKAERRSTDDHSADGPPQGSAAATIWVVAGTAILRSTRPTGTRTSWLTALRGGAPFGVTLVDIATNTGCSTWDLEEFFPSINFGRVRGYLIKNRHFALHNDVATVIRSDCVLRELASAGEPLFASDFESRCARPRYAASEISRRRRLYIFTLRR